jgi:hypothetical protein
LALILSALLRVNQGTGLMVGRSTRTLIFIDIILPLTMEVGPEVKHLLMALIRMRDPDRNMFFLGFRYGQSKFDETINYSFTDSNFGDFQKSVTTSQVTGRWGEITAGLRVKIWKGLWMGYTARLKFAPGTSSTPGVVPFDIPGYGRAEKSTYWGLNYQVFWKIPFRKLN